MFEYMGVMQTKLSPNYHLKLNFKQLFVYFVYHINHLLGTSTYAFYKRFFNFIHIPEMEQQLEKVLNDINSQPETVGCLITNRQGLCLGAKGKINPIMSGIGMALSEQACKLEPNLNPPTIVLHSGNKRCIIQKDGEITGIIYKQNSN